MTWGLGPVNGIACALERSKLKFLHDVACVIGDVIVTVVLKLQIF